MVAETLIDRGGDESMHNKHPPISLFGLYELLATGSKETKVWRWYGLSFFIFFLLGFWRVVMHFNKVVIAIWQEVLQRKGLLLGDGL